MLWRSFGSEVFERPCLVVGTGLTSSWWGRKVIESYCTWDVATKSPGTVSGVPYTSSAEEQCRSSLGAVLIPSNTHGSSSNQLGVERRALMAVFQVPVKTFY